jgi:signal transduction histidine kinase
MTAYEILAEVPYFGALPSEVLKDICRASRVVDIPKGEVVIKEGSTPGALLVVADGSFEAVREVSGNPVVLGIASKGEVLGEMSLLEGNPASATLRALTAAQVVEIPAGEIQRLTDHPQLLQGMFLTVIRRLRERESSLVQAGKLAALGTMTAGLLHEVNNPAAAIKRSAAGLVEAVDRLVERHPQQELPALERASREDQLADHLAAVGIPDAGSVAASLVAEGWTPAELEALSADRSEQERLVWLIHARVLAHELATAASQLSELVGAVKNWVYLDQGPRQLVDLNQQVNQSVSLLKHKLGTKQLVVDTADSLPTFEGSGVELNQVITNLLDNAIDAAKSRVEVVTRVDGDEVVGEVIDDGPGIPTAVKDRMWDPFFTTKPPGQGSGLGLALVRRIVESHHGRLDVETGPDGTKFIIRIPQHPG